MLAIDGVELFRRLRQLQQHGRRNSDVLAGLLLGLSVFLLSACDRRAEEFVEDLARSECKFAQRCVPVWFEQSCQLCDAHDQCPTGACDRRTGQCRDQYGRIGAPGELNTLCASQLDCGSLSCRAIYDSKNACLDVRSELRDRDITRCEFDSDIAAECLRLSSSRSCSDAQPEACNLVFRNCDS